MPDIKAKVENTKNIIGEAKVESTKNIIGATTRSAYVIARRLDEYTDVNTEILDDGSVLVYNTNKEEWISTTLLNKHEVDAGEF